MTPGEIIQRRRAELGLTQAQLAERIGRTSSTVQRWERGVATPPKSLLPTLATALQVSERDLGVAFGRETAPPVEAVETPTSQPSDGAEVEAPREASGAIAIEEQPTMAVPASAPVASAPQAKRRSPMRRAPAVDSAEGLSYIERPQQRYRYLLRATLTVVVGIVLLFILFWAFGELRTAIGDVWDLFGDDAPPGTAPGTDF